MVQRLTLIVFDERCKSLSSCCYFLHSLGNPTNLSTSTKNVVQLVTTFPILSPQRPQSLVSAFDSGENDDPSLTIDVTNYARTFGHRDHCHQRTQHVTS